MIAWCLSALGVKGFEVPGPQSLPRPTMSLATKRCDPLLEYGTLMTEQKSILVTAGIVVKGDRILICQRHHSDAYGMQWEFPGGKVKEGEELKACLRRELAEELTIEAEIGEEVFRVRHQYPDRNVEVVFFVVRNFRGTVRNQVFEAVEWVRRGRLAEFDFLEADRELVRRISNAEIV